MQTISTGYRGLALLIDLNFDRILMLGTIVAALLLGGLIGSVLYPGTDRLPRTAAVLTDASASGRPCLWGGACPRAAGAGGRRPQGPPGMARSRFLF